MSSTCVVCRKRLRSSTSRRGIILFLIFLSSFGGFSAAPRPQRLRCRLRPHRRQLEEVVVKEIRRRLGILPRLSLFPAPFSRFRWCRDGHRVFVIALPPRPTISDDCVASICHFIDVSPGGWSFFRRASIYLSPHEGDFQPTPSFSSAVSILGCRQSIFFSSVL